MDNNSFMLSIIAKLNKQLSKSAINNDLKTLDNTMSVRVLAKLSKTLARKELNKSLKELDSLYVNVGAKAKLNKDAKNKLQQDIQYLQRTISDLEIGLKASKASRFYDNIDNIRQRAQKRAQSSPINFNLEIKKNKLVSDIEYLGKRYSKLFSNVSASNKYENILNHAYNASNQKQIADTKDELAAFTSELKANGLAAQSTKDKWSKLIARAKELFSVASIVRVIFTQVRQAVSTVIDLDKVYTDLIKVNDQLERGNYAEYLSECNKRAKELATTQKALIEGATEFSKSGYDLDMSNKLTEISTILSNVGDMSASDSAKAIISGVQAYDVVDGYTDVVDKAKILVDIFNEIGNTASISTAEIAQGVQSVGSVFADANTSVQEFISLLSAGNRQYQNADALALSLRTAALRIRGCTSELAAMGEETDNVYTSASKLADKIRGLTNINGSGGVQILEADGETFRSIYDIFLDISKVYQQMSDTDASALLELIAGKNRASAISAVLNNMSEAQEIYQRSLNAAGSAQEEYNKYLESTEAHIKQFQATLVETYTSFINGDMVSHVADIGTVILDLNNKTGLLQHTLIAIAALKIGEGITSIGGAIAGTISQMNTLGSAIQQVKNLPLDDVLRTEPLVEIGEATKNLTEKNLKLLLSQKGLEDSDKILILQQHNLTETEAVAKLEKMGLTDATKKNTAANIVNAGSANVSSVAFKGLAASIRNVWAAMSLLQKASIILAAVSTAWSIASKFVDNYNQKAEKARERTSKLFDEFKNLNNTLADHKKTVAELADRYDELANGVNLSNNKNKTLSTDEYEEFLKINKQLADSFPSLSKGIDENGNSILSLGTKGITAKEQLEELLKTEEDLNNFRISESIDEAFAGVLTYVKEAEQASENLKNSLSETNKEIGALQEYLDNGIHLNQDHYLLFEVDLTDRAKTNYMFALQSAANKFYDSLNQDRKLELRSHEIFGASNLLYQSEWGGEVEGFYANLLQLTPDEIEQLEKIIEDNVGYLKGALADQFDSQRQGFQEQIYQAENEWTDFLPNYISAMKSKSTFKKLDSDMQDIAIKIVEGLDYSLANEFEKYDPTDSYSYIRDKLIVPLSDLSEDNKQLVKDNFNELFTLDSDDISQNNQEQIDQIIKDIAAILEKDPIEIRAILGFDVDISEAKKNYQESLDRAKRKFSGYEYDDRGFQTNISNELGKVVDEFYEANVKTQDDIALWEKVTENIYDAVEAMDAYIEAKNQSSDTNETPDFFTQLNNSKDSLDKFQSSVKSAYDAYSTLLSGNYSSNELLDSIQAINQAMSDIGKDIQWESMFGGGIGLAQVNEEIERNLREYAEEILRNAGITDAEFAEILIDSIIQAQKATAEFSAMNTQLDNLQASYRTLTDAIEYYNETGFINLDTLQSLLTADENLIKMLEVENGQLVINQEAYEELVAVQLLEFKEKLDNAAAAEIEALALSKAEEATNNNAQASEDAVAKLDAETEAFKRNTEAASENAITKAIANAEDAGVSEEEIQNILDKYDEVWNAAINNYHKDFPTFMLGRDKSGSGSGSGSSSSAKDFEETFDWIETAIDRIERSISNLDLKASSVYRSWSERNSNLKAELLDVKKEMDIQASGYNRYMQQANSVGLSEEWASKVRNGQIDINSITDKALAEQIKSYTEYYERALDCQDAVESLRESVSKLYETAFDNIVSQFDSIVSVIENSKSMLDEQINQAEERGYIANVAYYEALINVEQKNIEQLTKERTSLQSALADAVSNGAIAEGSAEWADMQQKINDVTLSIEQANTAMIKYGNSIRDIQWQIFDLIQDRISRISSESDFLINLLSYDKQYDDRGQLTDTGMSTVGLHGMNYNVYMAQADKYAEEMLRINEELAKDPNNLELYNRKAELIELQQESIIAAENEKQAIIDMVEEGINLELDALKELIDTYTDALDAQKDLYDYQKNIAKQTEEIASLQKQLSAYEGDLSEEARQKVQQIKVSLENAQKDLQQTEMDKYFENSKKLLNDLYQEYELALNQRLDNIDALIADMIASSNANAGMISDTLSSKADSVGYYLSESMEDIWNTNTGSMLDALAMYDSNIMGGFAEVNTSVGEVIRGVTETVSSIGNVNTTITNAIGSVTGNMQAILDKLSALSTMQSSSATSSYYGGSGGTGTLSSGSSGTGSSGSGSSGLGGNGGSGFFINKKDSYSKGALNIDTSIIDRLKYHDFDSSFSARQMYYSKMGLPGTYTGTAAQNAKMLDWMKLNGYKNGVLNLKQGELAWTQEGGEPEMITYPNGVIVYPDGTVKRPDGSELKLLPQGANVFPADASKTLSNFANNPSRFLQDQIRNMLPPAPQNISSDNITNYNTVNLQLDTSGIHDKEGFIHFITHDRSVKNALVTMATGEGTGHSTLKKYNA